MAPKRASVVPKTMTMGDGPEPVGYEPDYFANFLMS